MRSVADFPGINSFGMTMTDCGSDLNVRKCNSKFLAYWIKVKSLTHLQEVVLSFSQVS